jgi:integrase
LKTEAARREIDMSDYLRCELLRHKAASRFKADTDFVFCTRTGAPFPWSNVATRGLHKAAESLRAPRPKFHNLRDTFASMLIANGIDVVTVAKQLGHSDPSITLTVYARQWEERNRGEQVRAALDGVARANPVLTADGSGRML